MPATCLNTLKAFRSILKLLPGYLSTLVPGSRVLEYTVPLAVALPVPGMHT